MSKTTRKTFEFGNFRVTGMCVVADIAEKLRCATEPGKQEVFSGIARIDYKTNVGSTELPEWEVLPKNTDLTEKQDNSAVLEARIKDLEDREATLLKRIINFEEEIDGLKQERTKLSEANKRLAKRVEELTEERDAAVLQVNPDDFLKGDGADASN